MKYIFNVDIPTTSIQLRDDEDVKPFIRLKCIRSKLPIPLFVKIKQRSKNHKHESIINTNFNCDTLSQNEKEINGYSKFIHSSSS